MSYSHQNELSMMTHNVIHDCVDPSIEICRKPHLSRVHCDRESHHASAVAVHQHTQHSCQRSCCASTAWPVLRTLRLRCHCPPQPTRPGTPAPSRPRGGGEVEQREQSTASGAEPPAVRPRDGHPPPPMPRLHPPAMPLAAARPSRCSPR